MYASSRLVDARHGRAIPAKSAPTQSTRRKDGVFFIRIGFIVTALYGGIPVCVNAPENPCTGARCSLGRRREVAGKARDAGIRWPIVGPLAQAAETRQSTNLDSILARVEDHARGASSPQGRDFEDASRNPPERAVNFPRSLVLARGSLEPDRPRHGHTAWRDSKDAERLPLCSRQRSWTGLLRTGYGTNQTAGLTAKARRASEILLVFQRIAYCLGDDHHGLSRAT